MEPNKPRKLLTGDNLAIIFDFGGVLIDWNPRHLYRKFFPDNPEGMERFLREIHFTEWNLRQDEGRSFSEAVAEWCDRFPQYCDLIRAYDTRWEETISGPICPTVEILRVLHQAGYTLYGLSNWSAEKYRLVRHKYAFFGWFDEIIVSGEVGMVKPEPRIYALLLERIGRAAQQCLYIDDSAQNVVVARKLGFQAIQFQSAEQLRSSLIERKLLSGNGRGLQ
jgi:2-haloacid dehalogenase